MDDHQIVSASGNKEIKIYTINKNGDVVVNPKFIELWSLLVKVGNFNYMGGFTTTTFPLPSMSSSKLRGVPFLTDPSSPVKILTFNQITNVIPLDDVSF